MGDVSIEIQGIADCNSHNMDTVKMIFKVRSIAKQDITDVKVIMFVSMITAWVMFQLKYCRKQIVTVITRMLLR